MEQKNIFYESEVNRMKGIEKCKGLIKVAEQS